MKIYGAYQPADHIINIPEAIIDNLFFFSKRLLPKHKVTIICAEWISSEKKALLGYNHYQPKDHYQSASQVFLANDQHKKNPYLFIKNFIKQKQHEINYWIYRRNLNMFGMTNDEKMWKHFFSNAHPEDYWLIFWMIILHELRHLVQYEIFQLNDKYLFNESDLQRIKTHCPKRLTAIQYFYSKYKHKNPEIKRLELDAIIVSFLTASTILTSKDGDEINGEILFDFLLLPADQFTNKLLKKFNTKNTGQAKLPPFSTSYKQSQETTYTEG